MGRKFVSKKRKEIWVKKKEIWSSQGLQMFQQRGCVSTIQ